MKRLTIEEKAQRYDKALTIARNIVNSINVGLIGKDSFEAVFPELKENGESDDENIKKALISFVRNDGWKFTKLTKEEKESWIAWIENMGKQKPTGKTEPKFKAGYWFVQNERKNIIKIVNATPLIYKVVDILGCHHTITNTVIENNYHLWTIQDAKDGDVLCYKDEISLYKHYIKNYTKQETTFGGFVYHCCYDGKRFIIDSLYSLTEQDKMDIHPATKEQRDVLFSKMKEVGYEWNTEKKLLKKIEQKPAEWEPQTGDIFRKKGTASPTYYLCDKLEDGITFGFVENREVGFSGGEITIFTLKQDYELVERPNSIEDVVEEELNKVLQAKDEQTLAEWSEEDNRMCKAIIDNIQVICEEGYFVGNIGRDELIDWLKSLKDRLLFSFRRN